MVSVGKNLKILLSTPLPWAEMPQLRTCYPITSIFKGTKKDRISPCNTLYTEVIWQWYHDSEC